MTTAAGIKEFGHHPAKSKEYGGKKNTASSKGCDRDR